MKIISLKTKGFRKFAGEFNTNFYEDVSYITAGNHRGKTNILFATVWAFLGSNLTGDERVSLINKNKSDCSVELTFKDNSDIEHTIIRYKNKYNSSKNFLLLDGNVAKQEDLITFYQNKNLFLSVINLSYFVNLLPAKQKELVDKYLPNVDLSEVYEQLSEEDKKILDTVPKNAKLYISELDDEVKFQQNKITNINGQIEYAESISNQPLSPPPSFEKQEELDFAIQELDSLKKEKVISSKKDLQKQLSDLQNEELDIKANINNLENELQSGKKIYKQMLNQEDCCCPTCDQIINGIARKEAIKQYKDALINKFNSQTKLKEKYKQKHFDRITCEGKIVSIEQSNSNISFERVKELENIIKTLEQEKQENLKLHNEYSIKLANIQKAKNDIEQFKIEIELLNKSIENIKSQSEIAKKLYFNSIKAKMHIADSYLKNVKIKFYKVVKSTAEIKDDFVITYKNRDFSTLSKSEKIAASLEIANMLNKITGLNAPLFIDDSESYPDFDFISMYKDTQILIAQVKKHRALRIANKQEKITGCKTYHISCKRIYNKQLVA